MATTKRHQKQAKNKPNSTTKRRQSDQWSKCKITGGEPYIYPLAPCSWSHALIPFSTVTSEVGNALRHE